MKIVFIGGGSYYLLPILRAALRVEGLLDNGEIDLFDLNRERAEAMGRMVQKSPEYRDVNCRVCWSTTLEEALPGADAVVVILMGGDQLNQARSKIACQEAGYFYSDNLSLSGAFLGINAAHIVLNVARTMERYCPHALLMNFANPEAVLSGLVNNHTRINAVGVCQGAYNHKWDLTRLIFHRDEGLDSYTIHSAGVNHMAFIIAGRAGERDIFELFEEATAGPIVAPDLPTMGSERAKENVRRGLEMLADLYRRLGVILFSSEHDGLLHLCYDEARRMIAERIASGGSTEERIYAAQRISPQKRSELDAQFWERKGREDSRFQVEPDSVMIPIFKGLKGMERARIVTSRRNDGAITGIADRTIVEYSQVIYKGEITPTMTMELPDSVAGITHALAIHQTMLGDAIVSEDPHLLAQALMAYPVNPYSDSLREICKKLVSINRDEMPKALQRVVEYL
jgi:alpha-galactosidase/6-phospho-beta-glucosidase family protein